MRPRRVAITGAAGYLGGEMARRCIAENLDVLGLDVRRPTADWPAAAQFALQDVTSPSLSGRLQEFGADALVHLAWVFDPIHDQELEEHVDVGGTRNTFEAAAAAGVKRIVYPSSTTSYGIDAARTAPLVEDDDTVPHAAYPYGRFKAEVERWIPEFRRAHPDIDLVVARACIILGPMARNIVTHVTQWPVMFRVAGFNPPMQFLHEDDATELMWWALTEAPGGTFNAAGHGVVSFKEICKLAGRPCVALPAPLLYGVVALGWRLRLLRFPAGLLDYIRYPWVADTSKLTDELGFRPRFSTRQALQAYFDSRQS